MPFRILGKHQFHAACLHRHCQSDYHNNNPTCPLCREPIPDDVLSAAGVRDESELPSDEEELRHELIPRELPSDQEELRHELIQRELHFLWSSSDEASRRVVIRRR